MWYVRSGVSNEKNVVLFQNWIFLMGLSEEFQSFHAWKKHKTSKEKQDKQLLVVKESKQDQFQECVSLRRLYFDLHIHRYVYC